MNKLNWEKPEVLALGVEGTREEAYDMYGNPLHYCHATNTAHSNKDCTSDHPANNGCKGGDHAWNGMQLSKCCCGVALDDPTFS